MRLLDNFQFSFQKHMQFQPNVRKKWVAIHCKYIYTNHVKEYIDNYIVK